MNFFYALLTIVLSIGSLNWIIWFIRRGRSVFYTDFTEDYNTTCSVVIPVYKEKEFVLKNTINSILKNNPEEIILILDYTEKENMEMLEKEYGKNKKIKRFFIKKPGKRPALAYGIRKAIGEIVILVDSDTSWASKDFLKNLIRPFALPEVGGAGTRQRVKNKETWAQRLIDWMLDIKYTDYISSDSLSGSVLCLSGRTAAYRKNIILPLLDKLENEE